MEARVSGFRYIPLQGVRCRAGGVAQVEDAPQGLCIRVGARGTEDRLLRALLVCGDENGAVLDLGRLTPDGTEQAACHGTYPTCLRLWDAIVLAEDWPSGQIVAAGFLAAPPNCALWQLQDAVRRFLCVPAE